FILSVRFGALLLTVKCCFFRQLEMLSRLLPPPPPPHPATITAMAIRAAVKDVGRIRSMYPKTTMESVEWITDLARFSEIAAAWDRLAGAQEMPFLLSTWLLAWWRGFGATRGLRIGALWRDDAVAAGIPL